MGRRRAGHGMAGRGRGGRCLVESRQGVAGQGLAGQGWAVFPTDKLLLTLWGDRLLTERLFKFFTMTYYLV